MNTVTALTLALALLTTIVASCAVQRWWDRRQTEKRVRRAFSSGVCKLADGLEHHPPSVEADPDVVSSIDLDAVRYWIYQGWTGCCRAMRVSVTPDLVVPDDLSGEPT